MDMPVEQSFGLRHSGKKSSRFVGGCRLGSFLSKILFLAERRIEVPLVRCNGRCTVMLIVLRIPIRNQSQVERQQLPRRRKGLTSWSSSRRLMEVEQLKGLLYSPKAACHFNSKKDKETHVIQILRKPINLIDLHCSQLRGRP